MNPRFPQPTLTASRACGVLLILLAIAAVCAHVSPGLFSSNLACYLVLSLAGAAACAGHARRLPFQSVVLAAAIIVAISCAEQILRIPLASGRSVQGGTANFRAFLSVPCVLLWVTVVLNSRGLARLIVRPFRQLPAPGFWVLGISTILAVVDLHLWGPALKCAAEPVPLHSPWDVSVAATLGLLMNVAITPALIDKRSVEQPADFQPLALWMVLTVAAFLS